MVCHCMQSTSLCAMSCATASRFSLAIKLPLIKKSCRPWYYNAFVSKRIAYGSAPFASSCEEKKSACLAFRSRYLTFVLKSIDNKGNKTSKTTTTGFLTKEVNKLSKKSQYWKESKFPEKIQTQCKVLTPGYKTDTKGTQKIWLSTPYFYISSWIWHRACNTNSEAKEQRIVTKLSHVWWEEKVDHYSLVVIGNKWGIE